MLRVNQLAKLISLSPSKIYQMCSRGEIQHRRIGGAIRFAPEDVEVLMEQTKKTKLGRSEPESRKSPAPRSKPRRVVL